MVALDMLRGGEFHTIYAYFREELAYVRRLHSLIRVCESKNSAMPNVSRRCFGCS